jgi:hypothetical protein
MAKEKCKHSFSREMEWPDGGTSTLCEHCLMTKWEDGEFESGWQDHGYKSISDWYKEAMEFQIVYDKCCSTMEINGFKKVKEIK